VQRDPKPFDTAVACAERMHPTQPNDAMVSLNQDFFPASILPSRHRLSSEQRSAINCHAQASLGVYSRPTKLPKARDDTTNILGVTPLDRGSLRVGSQRPAPQRVAALAGPTRGRSWRAKNSLRSLSCRQRRHRHVDALGTDRSRRCSAGSYRALWIERGDCCSTLRTDSTFRRSGRRLPLLVHGIF
jgi:hypothetical protein